MYNQVTIANILTQSFKIELHLKFVFLRRKWPQVLLMSKPRIYELS